MTYATAGLTPVRIALLTSARDAEAAPLLQSLMSSVGPDAEIVVVAVAASLDSYHAGFIAEIASAAGIPNISIDPADYRRDRGIEWRESFEEDLIRELNRYKPEVGILVGYMLIARSTLLESMPIVNLHPALPDGPVGSRRDVVRSLYESHAEQTGVMLHAVTADLDRGPALLARRIDLTGVHWDKPEQEVIGEIDAAVVREEPAFLIGATAEFISVRPWIGQWPPKMEVSYI